MSEYFFGLGSGWLGKRADRIAEDHGASLVNVKLPGEGKRHWFAISNRGEPFNSRRARAVMDEINADEND